MDSSSNSSNNSSSTSSSSSSISVAYNESIHIKATDVKDPITAIRLCELNVGNGVNAQRLKNFEERAPKHVDDLKAINPDIAVLLEMRTYNASKLPTDPPECKIKPRDFLHMCCSALDVEVITCKRNAGEMAFGQAILYNPTKFFPKAIKQHWLSNTSGEVSSEISELKSETPEVKKLSGWGSLVLEVEFNYVYEGKILWIDGKLPCFKVLAVHLPPDAAVKIMCMKQLNKIINKSDIPTIVSGTFNSFYSENGAEQMNILLANGFTDLTTSIISLDKVKNTGTFLGYEDDAFKYSPSKLGHSDHICVKDFPITEKPVATIWTTTKELATRSTPSDHVGIVVNIEAIKF